MNPCPFCGATQDLDVKHYTESEAKHCYVACWNCNACGPLYPSKDLAEMGWNTRAQEDYEGQTCGTCAWRIGAAPTIETAKDPTFCRNHSIWLKNNSNACPDYKRREGPSCE